MLWEQGVDGSNPFVPTIIFIVGGVVVNNRFDKIYDDEFIKIFNRSISKSDIINNLHLPNNGTSQRFVNDKIKELNLDINIIQENNFKKYHIRKVCPVCGKEFFVPTTSKASKQKCCSYACSNTYFRSGKDNGNYDKATHYSTICFRYHPHKCCVCGEENIVAVHHYDGNHYNNDIANLVPLCPTHHNYWHSRFRHLIQNIVDDYVKNFRQGIKKGNNNETNLQNH